MKRTIITLAILIAATISIFGQSKDEQAVRQYLSEVDAMLVKDDVAALEQFTAEDLIFVGTGGKKWTRAEQIENAKKSTWSFASVKRDIDSIRVFGDTPYNIRVCIIEPGFIVTPILDTALVSLSTAANSAYPNAIERTQMMFTQGQQTGGEPQVVAEKIELAINSNDAKLRFPVGDGAQVLLDGRARMSDEEWIAMHRHSSHEDYFQEFGERFAAT